MAPESTNGTAGAAADASPPDLSSLFHRLNNQLGIILANAELLESRLNDEIHRARAGHVVASALEAIAIIQDIRRSTGAVEIPNTRPSAD